MLLDGGLLVVIEEAGDPVEHPAGLGCQAQFLRQRPIVQRFLAQDE